MIGFKSAVVSLTAIALFAQTLGAADAPAEKKTAKSAYALLSEKAEKGNPDALVQLGVLRLRGANGVKQDVAQAFRDFRNAAEMENAAGQFWTGFCMTKGVGTAKNVKGAIPFLEKAAAGKESKAMVLLAQIYAAGLNGNPDLTLAFQYLLRGASAKNGDAAYMLGVWYRDGIEVKADAIEAHKWFERGVEYGSLYAQAALADMILKDADSNQEEKTAALRSLEEAAQKGNALAHVLLGDVAMQANDRTKAFAHYQRAAGSNLPEANLALARYFAANPPKAESYLRKAVAAGSSRANAALADWLLRKNDDKSNAEAVKILQKLAENNSVDAQVRLGRIYLTGLKGVAKNYPQAYKYLHDAAAAKNVTAQYFLSLCYKNGWGVKADAKIAAAWALSAAEAGDSYAQLLYATYCQDGVGMKQNSAEALKYLKLSAAQGNKQAAVLLGDYLVSGVGTETPASDDGVALLRESAEAGDARAQYLLGKIYSDGVLVKRDYKEGFKWLLKADAQNYAKAYALLALYYRNGYGDVKADPAKMLDYLNKGVAAKQGDAIALMGRCYLEGNGVKQDVKKAVEYFRQSANMKDGEGEFWMGLCCLKGIGVQAHIPTAIMYLKRSAAAKNPNGCFYMGMCYKDGLGVKEDLAAAAKNFEIAANGGNPDAMYQYGLLLENGRGVKKDPAKAFGWYERSAAAKNPYGLCALAQCYESGSGVAKDARTALFFYRRSADLNNTVAQFLLAQCLERGIGTSVDRHEARFWYERAARNGFELARDRLKVLDKIEDAYAEIRKNQDNKK
ncbi:MAG: sel1 repeat family protein [Lentisphaeria bacterium]|nr:sel1 repeat family protein [Lentisphaeria bacterium]